MITNEKVLHVGGAMAVARKTYNDAVAAADAELDTAIAAYHPSGDATENWNMVEAFNKHRNTIEGAAFALRLAFLKAAGRRE